MGLERVGLERVGLGRAGLGRAGMDRAGLERGETGNIPENPSRNRNDDRLRIRSNKIR